MKLSAQLICTLFMIVFSVACVATPGREGEIRGKSETGKVQIIVRTSDMDASVVRAQLVLDKDTIDFMEGCDAYPVIDPANHLITLFIQQKGTSPGAANMKSLKMWATPSSFVKMVEGPNSWRFKMKIVSNMIKEPTMLDCVYMRLP